MTILSQFIPKIMNFNKLFPIAAMLLVVTMGSCEKEQNTNSATGMTSVEKKVVKPQSGALKVVNLGVAGDFVILSKRTFGVFITATAE